MTTKQAQALKKRISKAVQREDYREANRLFDLVAPFIRAERRRAERAARAA